MAVYVEDVVAVPRVAEGIEINKICVLAAATHGERAGEGVPEERATALAAQEGSEGAMQDAHQYCSNTYTNNVEKRGYFGSLG